jgi:LysR family pca operon transcriptional activator
MIDGRIKFRHLQCFLAVAKHGSLQKASVNLSITSPAVSKTIKELEEMLKMPLFERGRRGTQMTPQAEIFATYAGAAVTALQQASDCMGPARIARNPVIRVGATQGMSVAFVPQMLMAFNLLIPNIQVSVLTGPTRFLMEQLREGEFDLVLCRHLDPEKMVGLSFEYLYSDPLVVVVRPGHPLLEPPSAEGKESKENDKPRPYLSILPPKTSANRHAAAPLALALNIRPAANFIESPSISFGYTYTLNSDAIWFVPWCAVQHNVKKGELIRLSPSPQGNENHEESVGLNARSTGLMMRSDFVPTADMRVLIGAMRECASHQRAEVI